MYEVLNILEFGLILNRGARKQHGKIAQPLEKAERKYEMVREPGL